MSKFGHFSTKIKSTGDILKVLEENENQIAKIILSEKDIISIVIKGSTLEFRVTSKPGEFEIGKEFKQFLISKVMIIVEHLIALYNIVKTMRIKEELVINDITVYVGNFGGKVEISIYRISSNLIAAQIYDFGDTVGILVDLQESKPLGKIEMSKILNVVAERAL